MEPAIGDKKRLQGREGRTSRAYYIMGIVTSHPKQLNNSTGGMACVEKKEGKEISDFFLA